MKRSTTTTLSFFFALLILFSHTRPATAQLSHSTNDAAVRQQTDQSVSVATPVSSLSNTSGRFVDSGQRLGNATTSEVALGDLDKDGDLDAFFCNIGQRTNSNEPNEVWFNNGKGVFTDSGQRLANSRCESVALGDLDNDNDLDAFIANGFGGRPDRVWLNNGAGLFVDTQQSLGSADSKYVVLGDLDKDGDLDAFVANLGANEVWINNGKGVFSDSRQRLGSEWSEGAAIGDLDGDTDLDIFVANGVQSEEPDKVLLNDGSGKLIDSGQNLGLAYGFVVNLGDLDSDNDLDAFVGGYGGNQLWFNQGNGVFVQSTQKLNDVVTTGLALGDLDADGDLDIFEGTGGFFDDSAKPSKIWLNDGNGTFTDSQQDLGISNTDEVALGDLDGDGDLDAITAEGHYDYGIPNKVWLNSDSAITCQTAFSDEFNATLDSRWSFLDPRNDATQSLTARPGYLRLSAPTGNDLWPPTNYNAPRLLQPIKGDFTIETHIEFAPVRGYQGAGLLIWQDDNNFLRLERGNAGVGSPEVSGIRLDKEEKGVYDAVAPTSQRPTGATNFELRLQRNGSRFMAWWRVPGQPWEYVGGTDTEFNAELLVGIALISEYDVTQTTADYDYFRLSCPRTLAPPVNLRARAGLDAVLLSWEPSAAFGVTGYHLYRQAAGEATFTRLTTTPITGLAYRDRLAPPLAASYTYYVTAVDAANQESDPSNTATVTPGKITLILPTVYAARGVTTTVTANLENGDGLCIGAMNLGIGYNPQIATATKVTPTSLTQGYTFSASFARPNEVQIASIGNCRELQGPGSLVGVDFLVQPTAAVSTTLRFVDGLTGTVLYDQENLATPIALNLVPGQIIVSNNGGYKRGDINGDGVVNASDVMLALQIAAGAVLPTSAQLSAGDVNGDQVINAGDAAMILYFSAKEVWPAAAAVAAYGADIAAAVIQIQPVTVAGDIGREVDVPLQISKGDQVAGATLILRYGKGLTYKSAQLESALTAQGYVLTSNPIGANEVRLSLVGPTPLAAGAQPLGKIRFSLDGDATNAHTQVAVIGAWLTDQAGRDFSLSVLQQTVVGGQGLVRINERVLLPLIRR